MVAVVCCAFYDRDGNCLEGYWDHIGLVLAAVQLLRRYYAGSLQRLYQRLGHSGHDLLTIAAVAHDAGKLVEEYRLGSRRRYRHETMSAYVAYKVAMELGVGEEAALTTALAVMLHHEPITFSALVTGLGLSRLPMMEVYAMIRRSDLRYTNKCDLNDFRKKLDLLRQALHLDNNVADTAYRAAEYMTRMLEKLDTDMDSVEEVLAELIAEATVSGSQVRRARVAALLHPLVLADQLAAECSPYRQVGKGTWLTRRALGRDGFPKAEPLPSDGQQVCNQLRSILP